MTRPHAIIIGASSGIGYALAEKLTSTHIVTALARRVDRMEPLAKLGANVQAVDVTEFNALENIVKQAVAAHGKLSVMVYCAGLQVIKPLRATSLADIQALMNVNVTGAIVCGRLFVSRLLTLDDAVFCAVSSIAARVPEPGILVYSAAKAALENLIVGLAKEGAPRRAVGVAPGWLDTEMTQSYGRIYDDAFRERLTKESPRGIASVASVVDAIDYLISDRAGHVTGQIITVDGGHSL